MSVLSDWRAMYSQRVKGKSSCVPGWGYAAGNEFH